MSSGFFSFLQGGPIDPAEMQTSSLNLASEINFLIIAAASIDLDDVIK